MNLKYLKQFLELCRFIETSKSPSMSQFANKVGITHTQVSRIVMELEKEFGFQLLYRDKSQTALKLTKKGEKLAKKIPVIFREIDSMYDLLKADEDLERGAFDLYTTTFLMDYWIAPRLAEFKRKHPRITLNLFGRDDSYFSTEEKKTMLTISAMTEENEDYQQIHLQDYHIGLWASSDYIKRNGRPEHPADLARHRIISFQRIWPDDAYPSLNWYMHNPDFSLNPDNFIIIRSSIGIMKAAEAGLGIFSLSEESIGMMGLKFERILPDQPGPVVPMCFSYPTIWKDFISILRIKEFLMKAFGE